MKLSVFYYPIYPGRGIAADPTLELNIESKNPQNDQDLEKLSEALNSPFKYPGFNLSSGYLQWLSSYVDDYKQVLSKTLHPDKRRNGFDYTDLDYELCDIKHRIEMINLSINATSPSLDKMALRNLFELSEEQFEQLTETEIKERLEKINAQKRKHLNNLQSTNMSGRIKLELDGKPSAALDLNIVEEDVIDSVMTVFLLLLSNNWNKFDFSFKYKNDEYKNISSYFAIVNTVNNRNAIHGFKFTAEKNGEKSESFTLLSRALYNAVQDGATIYAPSQSFGIIDSEYCYAGSREFKEVIAHGEAVTSRPIHLFFRRKGQNFTFYVLMNGKLFKKITKTDDAVTFYYTPISWERNEPAKDIPHYVFNKENSEYLLNKIVYSNTGAKFRAFNNFSISMPRIPGELNQETCGDFYDSCVKALYEAAAGSEMICLSKDGAIGQDFNKFFSDENADGRIELVRTDNCEYYFPYGDAEITVKLSMPKPNLIFEQWIDIPYPDLNFKSIAFDDQPNIELILNDDESLNVKITDNGKVYEGRLGSLTNEPDFDKTGIPDNPHYDKNWALAKDNLEIYRNVKDAIVRNGIGNCKSGLKNEWDKLCEEVGGILYGEDGMVPDENVILSVLQLKNEYDRTGVIPNLAIIGQAGTGKSTIAKRMGKLFGKGVLALSPSDLRGAYLGHTKYEVLMKLVEAAQNKQIFFVDEAYQLMDDSFGKEAVTLLLPLMTGDRTKVTVRNDKDEIEVDFDAGTVKFSRLDDDKANQTAAFEPGRVPIWISGYENEIREMISKNQGLYRRLKWVFLTTPRTNDLVKQFYEELENKARKNDSEGRKASILKKHFSDTGTRETVRNFFGWGNQPQNSKYFASHAGVTRFLENCFDSINFNADLDQQIERIISTIKKDIKRQISAVRKTAGNGKAGSDDLDNINVITDIDTRFKDLVGCKNQIAYMKSIVEMLANRSDYENNNIKVPKGALMKGFPGTGKTYIAKAVAGELQELFQTRVSDKRFGFMEVSGTELANKPASYITSIFNTAEEYDACILFIDEVDAIAKRREINPSFTNYLELIKQMDGIEKNSNVFILAATNAPEMLDPAFVRSGRIDKQLEFTLPEKEDRKELARRAVEKRIKDLRNYTKTDIETDINSLAEMIAGRMSGYTAGDIDNVVNQAYITYHQLVEYRETPDVIDPEFFKSYPFIKLQDNGYYGVEVKEGIELKEPRMRELYMFIDEEIERMHVGDPNFKKREENFDLTKNDGCSAVAIHEVGHAVASLVYFKDEKPFDTITTLPRGEADGYVSHSEVTLKTKSDFENRIRVLMGGRIAEQLFWNDNISMGAVSDIGKATGLARRMVELFGFSDEFGFMALCEPGGKYLGGKPEYTCSDAYREKSDNAVNELLKRLYAETLVTLTARKGYIESLAREIFEKETMSGEEFKKRYEELFAHSI